MNIKKKIKAIWDVLTKKHFVVYASDIKDEEELTRLFLVRNAKRLRELGRLSEARRQMIDSILYDRSVVLHTMCHVALGGIIPTFIYDCHPVEDFYKLKEQQIEYKSKTR